MKKDLRVKFFLMPFDGALNSRYQFISIVLAQGFKELGVRFTANINYWWQHNTNDYLFVQDDADADVHIYESVFFTDQKNGWASVDDRKINILVDHNDRMFTPALDQAFKHFALILRNHYLPDYKYRSNVIPWAFGFTNHTLEHINASINEPVQNRVMISYRKLHDIRKLSNQYLVPKLAERFEIYDFESEDPPAAIQEDEKSLWCQTGRRYDPVYYKELNRSLLNLAFGGTPIVPPLPLSLPDKVVGKIKRTLLAARYGKENIPAHYYSLVQYDSWRLWESFASNACPVFSNCDQFGITFPVKPIAGKHYIAVDGFDFAGAARRIDAMSTEQIQEISSAGRDWVLQHYSPKPTAERFLQLIKNK